VQQLKVSFEYLAPRSGRSRDHPNYGPLTEGNGGDRHAAYRP